jgi:Ca2+-transporting ATPase
MSWHSQSIDDVLRHFAVSRDGLENGEARRRLERYGPNKLAPLKPVSALRILADQFKTVVVYLLLAAAGLSFAMGDRVESIAIAAVS